MTPHEQVLENIADLKAKLDANNPGFATILRTIRQALFNQPDIATLLNEEDIAICVRGLEKQTGLSLAEAVMKAKGAGSKSMKSISVDDI